MASNPLPFQVEDNTDEDFFDKLVDDDDDMDYNVNATSSSSVAPAFTDGNDSDEARAFANLSISELDNNGEVEFDAPSTIHNDVDHLNQEIEKVEQINKDETVEEIQNPLVSSNSFAFDNLMNDHENDKNGAAEVMSDTTVISKSSGGLSDTTVASKSSGDDLSVMALTNDAIDGSGASGVKQVGWNAFHADPAENTGTGFGSYSDFFSELGGDNADDAFENIVGDSLNDKPQVASENEIHAPMYVENSTNYGEYTDGYDSGIAADQSAEAHDLNSSQYWDSQYPGWKYDSSTGQWYEVGGYDAGTNALTNANSGASSAWGAAEGNAEVSYLQQSSQYVAGAVAETGTTESVTNWNQAPQVNDTTGTSTNWNQVSQASADTFGVQSDWNQVSQASADTFGVQSNWNQASQNNNGYPPHMKIYPEYPGWYFDTDAQEWRGLESYTASVQSTTAAQDQMNHNQYTSTAAYSPNNDQATYDTYNQGNNYVSQGFGSKGQNQNWAASGSNYNQQASTMWLPDTGASCESTQASRSQLVQSQYAPNLSMGAHGSQHNSVHYGAAGSYYDNVNQVQNNFSMPYQSQGFSAGGNLTQQLKDSRIGQDDQKHTSNQYYSNPNSINFSQQQIQNPRTSYVAAPERSSAGRPAHALVSFGFGGKLIVMKYDGSSENMSIGNQNPVGGSVTVLNLAEVVNDNVDASNHGMGVCSYVQALCRQSVPGPLSGGSVGTKELNKWIDERIANLESVDIDYRKVEVLKLLLSLLKIGCQYYGKLRSPYGTDAALKENDSPESAVARLFASAKKNGTQFSQYGAVAQCLQQMPSEVQLRATAAEVQSLLVSGRKKDALESAQEGQLWGPALVLAAQLGDQYYVETVKQMALRQLVAGSPLRTLCLLIAGQPADVFSADSSAINSTAAGVSMPQQPAQFGATGMLDDWEENLAVITANRTKDDELVLIHLGDCLWKDRSDIIAAHICYLVAEANFEPYSDTARLCLVGADHLKFPRTYASPEAIQRTEIYEYSKTLGNSQFVLLPFQPYKLVYAHMLAEVGRISDALKYSQIVLKALKTARTPEVETLRHLATSLEERIKAHQQGGFSTNLAPKKLIGKLVNLFDTTAHRVVGLPPPVPTAGGTAHGNENHQQSFGPRVSTSQSTLAMSSLMPSQSTEPINEWAANSNRVSKHSRSVSEPDFGRSPRQGQTDSLKEESSSGLQDKASATGVTSRLGRFGFGSQLLQKTMGLVLKPRQGRQAKLGDTNKFYYDEKLKRWVEEGVEPPAAEAALPPPPKTSVFQNGTSDYNLKGALQNEAPFSNGSPDFKSPSLLDNNSGIPPLPPTSNQYSARGRMGVRSRYVDTFNQGGGNATNLFQSPPVPSIKPVATGTNPKFFVPAPVSNIDQQQQPVDNPNIAAPMQDTSPSYENFSSSPNDSFQSPEHQSSATMQRFASMNNISNRGTNNINGSFAVHSRRTASWSGSFDGSFSPPQGSEVKPLGEVLGIHPSSFMRSESGLGHHSSTSGGSYGDDLHEVEL